MSDIIEIKAKIKKIYSSYEAYINPALKFLLAAIILAVLNSKIGYMAKIDNFVVVIILALVCSFLPLSVTALIAAAFMLLHLYALGMECALVTAVVFILMFLIYARFVPNETIVILLTPMFFFLKVPYLIPVAMGLLGTPMSIISVSCGVIVAYLVEYISVNSSTLTTMEDATMITRVQFIVDGIIGNKGMIIMVIAFAITLMVVYTIRRRAMDHSWTIAIAAGVVLDAIILLFSKLLFDLDYSVVGILLGSIVAAAAGMVLQFFDFHVDYAKVENLQFEDDDYYYYVRAVPKITVEQPKKAKRPAARVTQSSSSERSGAVPQRRTSSQASHNGGSTSAGASRSSGTRTVHTANGTSRTVSKDSNY